MADEVEVTSNGIAKLTGDYILLRDAKSKLKKAYEEKAAKIDALMGEIGSRLEGYMLSAGPDVKSVKTACGTFYKSVRYTASIADGQAFMDFVKRNEVWQLLDRRANAKECQKYMAQERVPVPGVNLSALVTIGVRRPGAKKEDDE
jgi:hypothetical protein